ncbi:MAG: YeeE/YedE family protein [Chloroflexi bacterium]|nr:YeeE/YedE family protein [Chloroflexota bacterium]
MATEIIAEAPGSGAGNLLIPKSRQTFAGMIAIVLTAIVAILIAREDETVAAIWVVGSMFGFTLQRSRFCFASAFRDLFLFGSGRNMKGILVGMAVATLGFAAIMRWLVPNPDFGGLPGEAHVLPVGLSVVVAGLMFGFGMVIAGGCVSGSLYRMAEGYVASWVAIAGVIIGLGVMTHTWNWWWTNIISHEPKIWFPSTGGMGYAGGVVLTMAGLGLVYLAVTWWETKNGIFSPHISRHVAPAMTFSERVREVIDPVFKRGWPIVVGGAVIGFLGVLLYLIHMPLGVTGELMRASIEGMGWIGLDAPIMEGLSTLGGCTGRAGESGLLTHTFAITVGLLPGALIAALLAGEFRVRLPARKIRYGQSLAGGVLMGYASGLALGCTVGAFFSAVPSLSLSGWVFGAALAGGAFAGTYVIKRIP